MQIASKRSQDNDSLMPADQNNEWQRYEIYFGIVITIIFRSKSAKIKFDYISNLVRSEIQFHKVAHACSTYCVHYKPMTCCSVCKRYSNYAQY